MSNIKELYNSIEKIEKQAEILESNVQVLTKISDLQSNLGEGVNKIELIQSGFNTTSDKINSDLANINTHVDEIKKNAKDGIQEVVKENGVLVRDVKEYTTSKIESSTNLIQGYLRTEVDRLNTAIINDLTLKFNNISTQLTGENKELTNRINELDIKLKKNKVLIVVTITLILMLTVTTILLKFTK